MSYHGDGVVDLNIYIGFSHRTAGKQEKFYFSLLSSHPSGLVEDQDQFLDGWSQLS